jgi:predicted ferric reductase
LCLVLLLSYPWFRQPSYEIFLRTHQALAALLLYALWRHFPSESPFPRFYLYITVGLFLLTFLIQCGMIIYRNGIFGYSWSRAQITHEFGAVRVRIHLEKPLKTEAGQHINLWIPSVSSWSFMQSHPFVVISWADTPQKTLDLFIEPRRGLTRELLHHPKSFHTPNPLVLFSGPHGKSAAVDGYESILMVASGFGIAAQLPYLKRLIHGYNAREVQARRIHLVWQIRDIGKVRQQTLPISLTSPRSRTCCSNPAQWRLGGGQDR